MGKEGYRAVHLAAFSSNVDILICILLETVCQEKPLAQPQKDYLRESANHKDPLDIAIEMKFEHGIKILVEVGHRVQQKHITALLDWGNLTLYNALKKKLVQ